MKVYIDDQIFGLQRRGGISRYFVELAREFRRDPGLDIEVTTPPLWTINQHLVEAGWGRALPTSLGRRRRLLRAANRIRAPRRADVVHHTYYDRSYLHRGGPDSLRVVTVYDMIPELLPDTFPDGNPHGDKRAFVHAADLVLCISEATKRDLIDVYGVPSAPVMVTPLGVDARFGRGSARPCDLPDRFVLFVGSRGGYKDFSVLAESFSFARLPDDVLLLAVGGGRLVDQERQMLKRLGLGSRVLQVDLQDVDMPAAYTQALGFVFPSRYEGFGLPTLEAMSAGCPTILALSSSHPEVGGDAAMYFEPGNVPELASLLGLIVDDPAARADRAALGREQAAGFTWAKTARMTAHAYHQHAGIRRVGHGV